MKPKWTTLVLVSLLLGSASAPAAADHPAAKPDDAAAQIQKLLAETRIDTQDLQRETTLVNALAILEAKLPAGKRVSFQIDLEAFGDRLAQVAHAKVQLPLMKNVSLVSVLRQTLAQAGKQEEMDYAIRPSGVVVTRPRLAAHWAAYDVGDVVPRMPLMLSELQNQSPTLYQDLDPADGLGLLVRLVANTAALQPWETIEVRNGNRLAVLASPTRQENVGDLLIGLRRRFDVAVVMNARLYEVDRAFFAREAASLFALDKDSDERPAVVAIDGKLLKAISGQKKLQESDDVKLLPGRSAAFLSRQSVYTFAAGPNPDQNGQPLVGTGLAGASFEVRPFVSADRRFLRLQITQEIAQLVAIDKSRTVDPASGKEQDLQSPNIRKRSVTGTIQIPDGGAILMPVAYRPPGKENEDKVWLLAARPFIWIDEEVQEIRRGGGDLTPQSVWDSDVPKEEKPQAAKPLPLNDQTNEILQALVADVLTNPDLKWERESFGTPRDKTLALVDGEDLGWPKAFQPATHGCKMAAATPDPFVNQRRVLGIRLDRFDLSGQKPNNQFDAPIEVCLFNAGGSANGGADGGVSVYYVPKQNGKHWTVEWAGCEGQ